MKLKELKLRPLKYVNTLPPEPVKGEQGDKGADGRSIKGTDGINGTDGVDGINGTDGKDAVVTNEQVQSILREVRQGITIETPEEISQEITLRDLAYRKKNGKITALRKEYTDNTKDQWTEILGRSEIHQILNQVAPRGSNVSQITSDDGSVTLTPSTGKGVVDLSVAGVSAVDPTTITVSSTISSTVLSYNVNSAVAITVTLPAAPTAGEFHYITNIGVGECTISSVKTVAGLESTIKQYEGLTLEFSADLDLWTVK